MVRPKMLCPALVDVHLPCGRGYSPIEIGVVDVESGELVQGVTGIVIALGVDRPARIELTRFALGDGDDEPEVYVQETRIRHFVRAD